VGLGAGGRPVVRRQVGVQGVVGDLGLQVETVAQGDQLRPGHLLDLVGGVAGLDLWAEGPPLDGLGQDDRRRTAVGIGGQLVRRVQLPVVVPAAREGLQLLVGQVLDEAAQARVGAEEVLADVGAGLGGVLLEVAVGRGVHLVEQHAVDVASEQLVPPGPPDHLDDVPAGTTEHRLGLLDDLAVAPHRAVQALQVAIDDEDQVVEVLAAGDTEGADRLDLVELAVAEERPDSAGAGVDELPVQQVPVDVRLVDGADRPQPHRHRRELPEVGEEPGVRVAGQAGLADLLPEAVEVLLVETAFDERPGVDAR
jgi:hypothetical protein